MPQHSIIQYIPHWSGTLVSIKLTLVLSGGVSETHIVMSGTRKAPMNYYEQLPQYQSSSRIWTLIIMHLINHQLVGVNIILADTLIGMISGKNDKNKKACACEARGIKCDTFARQI